MVNVTFIECYLQTRRRVSRRRLCSPFRLTLTITKSRFDFPIIEDNSNKETSDTAVALLLLPANVTVLLLALMTGN